MRYRVNLVQTEGGCSAWVPWLPGCWAHGRTEQEAMENIRVAILSYLEALDEQNANLECRFVEVG